MTRRLLIVSHLAQVQPSRRLFWPTKPIWKNSGFSEHTVKAFTGDLRLLQNFHGPDTPIHEIGNDELNQFLYWLQYERGVPCSPKSYARRVTTMKSFFGWLTSIRITPSIQQPP